MRVITVAVLFVVFIAVAIFGVHFLGATEEAGVMETANNGFVAQTDVPAIDRLVPENLETATFALG